MSKPLIYTTTWVDQQRIMLSRKSQAQKVTYCVISLYNILKLKKKNVEMDNRLMVAKY